MTDKDLQAIRVHVEEDSASQFEAAALLAEVDRLKAASAGSDRLRELAMHNANALAAENDRLHHERAETPRAE